MAKKGKKKKKRLLYRSLPLPYFTAFLFHLLETFIPSPMEISTCLGTLFPFSRMEAVLLRVRQQRMMGNPALPVPPGLCASRIRGPHAHKALTHVKPNFSIFLLETTLLKRREANLPVRASHCEGHMKSGRSRPAGCDSASCFQCLGWSAALAPSPAADLTSQTTNTQVNWWDGP